MNKKIVITAIIALIVGIAIGAVSMHFIKENQKSGFVKGAEKTQSIFTGK